ncbi:uncharacterized protein, partial [Triticum aestivum]|uniref:uncharacterized protein n=1 Tax=Triticum aestivum TaxID=4565 RepID=UPI001D031BF1
IAKRQSQQLETVVVIKTMLEQPSHGKTIRWKIYVHASASSAQPCLCPGRAKSLGRRPQPAHRRPQPARCRGRLLPASPRAAARLLPGPRRHRLPASHLGPRAPDPAVVRHQHLRIRPPLAFLVGCTSQRRHPTPAKLHRWRISAAWIHIPTSGTGPPRGAVHPLPAPTLHTSSARLTPTAYDRRCRQIRVCILSGVCWSCIGCHSVSRNFKMASKKPTNKERKLKQERCMRMPVSHQTCIV